MKLKTCPQCGSTEINLYMGGITGSQYKCKRCDYLGSVILETETEKKT